MPLSALMPPEPYRRLTPDEAPPRSGKATAALVFGIVGAPLLGLLLGWFALGLGALALRDIRRNVQMRGRKIALAGLALGVFDIVFWLVLLATNGTSIFTPRFGDAPSAPAPAPHVARVA